MDPAALRNRLVMATSMWREATEDPLPRMPPGDPVVQIQGFELQLVEMLFTQATSDTARDVAKKTWDLVHDRPDEDPVKQAVVVGHDRLAKLSAEGSPNLGLPNGGEPS
jgi:hypothetical protein